MQKIHNCVIEGIKFFNKKFDLKLNLKISATQWG